MLAVVFPSGTLRLHNSNETNTSLQIKTDKMSFKCVSWIFLPYFKYSPWYLTVILLCEASQITWCINLTFESPTPPRGSTWRGIIQPSIIQNENTNIESVCEESGLKLGKKQENQDLQYKGWDRVSWGSKKRYYNLKFDIFMLLIWNASLLCVKLFVEGSIIQGCMVTTLLKLLIFSSRCSPLSFPSMLQTEEIGHGHSFYHFWWSTNWKLSVRGNSKANVPDCDEVLD